MTLVVCLQVCDAQGACEELQVLGESFEFHDEGVIEGAGTAKPHQAAPVVHSRPDI